LAIQLGIASLSSSINKTMLFGAGILGGIGFTMAMFVDNLAFTNTQQIDLGKISILIGSTTAAALGFLLLSLASKAKHRAI
jgi:NhaA family Na+:H+ antiporter